MFINTGMYLKKYIYYFETDNGLIVILNDSYYHISMIFLLNLYT